MSAQAKAGARSAVASWWRLGLLVVLILAAKSSLANWNYVPSGSMEPNLLVGDMIWVNHLAYDLRLPFSLHRVATFATPQRGDIVVARSPLDGTRIVKRLVAVPGDTVEFAGPYLRINGEPATLVRSATRTPPSDAPSDRRSHLFADERLLDHQRVIMLGRQSPTAKLRRFKLGEDEYFLLGDHRDFSFDSRAWGPIDRELILGRATHVVGSLQYRDQLRLRTERFFTTLN